MGQHDTLDWYMTRFFAACLCVGAAGFIAKRILGREEER